MTQHTPWCSRVSHARKIIFLFSDFKHDNLFIKNVSHPQNSWKEPKGSISSVEHVLDNQFSVRDLGLCRDILLGYSYMMYSLYPHYLYYVILGNMVGSPKIMFLFFNFKPHNLHFNFVSHAQNRWKELKRSFSGVEHALDNQFSVRELGFCQDVLVRYRYLVYTHQPHYMYYARRGVDLHFPVIFFSILVISLLSTCNNGLYMIVT